MDNNIADRTIHAYQELIHQQEELIKNLQDGLKLLLDEREENKIKPNNEFYKEF